MKGKLHAMIEGMRSMEAIILLMILVSLSSFTFSVKR